MISVAAVMPVEIYVLRERLLFRPTKKAFGTPKSISHCALIVDCARRLAPH